MEGCKCKPAKSFAQRIIEYQEFVSLVKRMREAQKERDSLSSKITFLTEEDIDIRANSIRKTMSLESEVDEYLKKMEE